MQSFKTFYVLVVIGLAGPQTASAQTVIGAHGAEGEPNRMRQWLVPSPAMDTAAHALLFRPPGGGPFPLAVIAHASTQNVLHRAQMPQPEYRALSARLVARGFAVLVPERLGHGTTGGYLEDQGGCDEADYFRAGCAIVDEIAAAARGVGGRVDFRVLGASGREGHWLAETETGIKMAGPELDRALKPPMPTAAKKQ
jgi:alpha-beta hydrolase superfamily lysophospholipase